MNRCRLMILLAVLAAAPPASAQSPVQLPPSDTVALPAEAVAEAPVSNGGSPDPANRFWVDADYLYMWVKGQALPPLLTTSPPGTSITNAGILGTPGTTILFGNGSTNTGARSGGRLDAVAWIDANQTLAVEGDFFFLENKSTTFTATSNGSTILSRPIVDSRTGMEAAFRIAFPGNADNASFGATSSSDGILGGGFMLRETLGSGDNFRFDVVGGWRYLQLSDSLDITSDFTSVSSASLVPPGTQVLTGDQFATKNTFNGFGIGVAGEYWNGPLSLQVLAKVSGGLNAEAIDIVGGTTTTAPGLKPVETLGGLLALPTNIGHFSRDQGSFVPEVNCKVGYQLTPQVRATLGYMFLVWDDVVRAGDQVSRSINPSFVPGFPGGPSGPPSPLLQPLQSNAYLQGLTLGLEVRF